MSHSLNTKDSFLLSWAPREAALQGSCCHLGPHSAGGPQKHGTPFPSEKACSLAHVEESAVACERPRAAGDGGRRQSCGECLQARLAGDQAEDSTLRLGQGHPGGLPQAPG